MTDQHTATDTAFTTTVRATRAPWALRLVHSPDEARVGGVIYVGSRELQVGREDRGPGSLQLVDRRLSRQHAGFRVDASDRLVLRDLGSKNGTFLGGRPIERQLVEPGDVIRVGDSLLVVFRERHAGGGPAMGLLGVSQAVAQLRSTIARVAPSRLSALVCGPTGTGKEVVARALHEHSGRTGPFVAINCAALPETLVESTLFGHVKGAFTGATGAEEGAFARAHRGTLFLDEVGEMALSAQPKLLRALELGEVTPVGASRSNRVDVRVVAATNRSLDQAMADGGFREDLFARLAGVEIETPRLCERPDDVLVLLRHFVGGGLRPYTADFAQALLVWSWPRNVRELKRLAERLPVLHPHVERWGVEHLPEPMTQAPSEVAPPTTVVPMGGPPDRDTLVATLERFDGNIKEAAAALGRSRRQLYRWMDQLGIDRGTGR